MLCAEIILFCVVALTHFHFIHLHENKAVLQLSFGLLIFYRSTAEVSAAEVIFHNCERMGLKDDGFRRGRNRHSR